MINFNSQGARRAAFGLSLMLLLPTVLFAMRSYGSYQLLRSAYEAGAPMTSSIRAWMTLSYIAGAYHVAPTKLLEGLGLPSSSDTSITVKSAAEQSGASPYQYAQRVQRVVAAQGPTAGINGTSATSSWLGSIGDQVLSELLLYGYPILGLTVLLGTVGLPLPQGVATLLAGSLAAQGRIGWIMAGLITVVASVAGDAIDYGCGFVLGREILQRYGRWLGLTAMRQERASLFETWGVATVFVTRTLASYLSSSARVLAGVSHYPFSKFMSVTVVGRVLWTSAYLGLGYLIGADLEAASGFLTNVSVLLVITLVLLLSMMIASGRA
jgi:membrane protein DedA with SNARE-associated domain